MPRKEFMEDETRPPVTVPSASEASLVRGGPFYRFQQAARLVGSNRWNLGLRIAILVAVGWLPLLLITIVLNPGALASLTRDYRVYCRILVAVPVLLVGEILMETRFRAVMTHIRQAGLLKTLDQAHMDGVIVALIRLRDSFLPELLIVLLLVLHSVASFRGLVEGTAWLSRGAGSDLHLTAAGWYAVLVSATIFQFLLGLALWKWLLWTFFAFQLSRRDLKLVATHPDGHGGLGFLGLTAAGFAPIAFAVTAVISATWRHDILYGGARLRNFELPGIVLIVIIALVALGPLVFFVPRLDALRRRGILEYGILGQIHSAEFHDKWIHGRVGHEAEFLQAPESSTLYGFGQSYEKIKKLNSFPSDRGALVSLVLSVVIPALPLLLTQIPLTVVFDILFKALR